MQPLKPAFINGPRETQPTWVSRHRLDSITLNAAVTGFFKAFPSSIHLLKTPPLVGKRVSPEAAPKPPSTQSSPARGRSRTGTYCAQLGLILFPRARHHQASAN